jgi:hypothetical protein
METTGKASFRKDWRYRGETLHIREARDISEMLSFKAWVFDRRLDIEVLAPEE